MYKQVDALFKRIQWIINHFRLNNTVNNENNNNIKNKESNPTTSKLKHSDLIKHMKAEKEDFDTQIEILRRNSTCTVSSYSSSSKSSSISNQKLCDSDLLNRLDSVARNIIETNQTNQFRMIKNTSGEIVQIVNSNPNIFINKNDAQLQNNNDTNSECTNKSNNKNAKRNDIFDFNPITKYFYYNKDTDKKHIDRIKIENNDFDREMFKKYNLKKATVKIRDVLSFEQLKDLKYPFRLTEKDKNHIRNEQKVTRSSICSIQTSNLKTSLSSSTIASATSTASSNISCSSSLIINRKASTVKKSISKRKSILCQNNSKAANCQESKDNENNMSSDTPFPPPNHESTVSTISKSPSEASIQSAQHSDDRNNESEPDQTNQAVSETQSTVKQESHANKSNESEPNQSNQKPLDNQQAVAACQSTIKQESDLNKNNESNFLSKEKKRKRNDILDDLTKSCTITESLISNQRNDTISEIKQPPLESNEPNEKNRFSLSSLLSKLRDSHTPNKSANNIESPKESKVLEPNSILDKSSDTSINSNKENDFEPSAKKIKGIS